MKQKGCGGGAEVLANRPQASSKKRRGIKDFAETPETRDLERSGHLRNYYPITACVFLEAGAALAMGARGRGGAGGFSAELVLCAIRR